jgi:hypothetical protein
VRKFFASLLAVSFLTFSLPAAVTPTDAASDLQLSVRTGYDGMVRPGSWAPVEVDLANAGPIIAGNVQLSVVRKGTGTGNSASASVDYTVPITVPEHTTKRFNTAIYVPPSFDQLQVSLIADEKTLISQDVTIQHTDPSQVLCGVLSNDPTAFTSLSGMTVSDGKRQPHLVQLDLPDLPTNPQLLSTLDCLIVSDFTTRGLTALQQSALSSWVNDGGVLTIGTGEQGAATIAGLPADLLPASIDGTVSLGSLSGLASFFGGTADLTGPWLMANLKVGDGATIASDENQPLVVVGRRGKGTVFMLALSPGKSPIKDWNGNENLWSYIFSFVPIPPAVISTFYRSEFGWGRVPREALTQGGTGSGPEALILLGALLAFGLLIGPINYLVLSRLGRRELALFTVPVLTAVSTAGALFYANGHRQGDVVVNQISLVRTWDGSGVGDLHSFVGVFALHAQNYQVTIPANTLLSSTAFPFQGQFARTIPNVKVLQTDAPEAQGLDIQPGTLNNFVLDGHFHIAGKIQATLKLDGDRLTGQITNGLSEPIREAAIVAGTSVQSIGDLKPGASHAVDLPLEAGSPVGFRDNGLIVDRLFPGTSHVAGAHHAVGYDVLSAALNPSQNFTSQVELSGVNLLGWLGSPTDPVRDTDTGRLAHQQTVFITNLSFQISSTPQIIPSQLVERQMLSSSYSARSDANGIAINSGDTAAYQYTSPIDPAHFAIRSLELDSGSDDFATGTLEFYNWRTQAWEETPYSVGNLPIPNPDRYFSATGLVRLRFRYHSAPAPMGAASITFNRFQLVIGGVGR